MEFTPVLDRGLQAIGERETERRNLGRLDDADRLVALQSDRQVQLGQGHELRLGDGVELLAGLGPEHLGSQDGFALDDALALQLAGVLELLLGAATGILGRPPEGLAPQDAVIRHGDFVGDRLEGAVGLELGDVEGELRLLEASQAAAEVADQPLHLELGQLVAGRDAQADG